MLPHAAPALSPSIDDREVRIQALVDQLRPTAEQTLRRLAERLIDVPDQQLFGQIEYDLRDAALDLAAHAHQTGLAGRKKGGTSVPALPAPAAPPPPSSRAICPVPS